MQTRSRGDLSWMIVSPVMNRVKSRFVELSQWVPDYLTLQVVDRKHQFRPGNRWPSCSKATLISVLFCDGDSGKLNSPGQRKW